MLRLWTIRYLKLKSLFTRTGFFGDYPEWSQAEADSRGYEKPDILEKVASAHRQVLDGKAFFERDGVAFDHPEYNFPLLSQLLYLASLNNNQLKVIDFGGALGSHYYQHRAWLGHIDLDWRVVEQPHFVDMGRAAFTQPPVRYFYSLEEALKEGAVHMVLMGCVLPYLPEPYALLDQIRLSRIPFLFIDKHPVIPSGTDRLTVQRVPASIYKTSYPAWFFSEQKWDDYFQREECLIKSDCPDIFNIDARYKSYFYRLNHVD